MVVKFPFPGVKKQKLRIGFCRKNKIAMVGFAKMC